MKVELNGFLYWKKDNYTGAESFQFLHWDCRQRSIQERDGRVFVKEHSFAVDIPSDFDPVPSQIADLEAEKVKARADFQARITEIDRRIQSLQAIEHEVNE